MGEDSGIQWTTNTFNPWWGCTKIPQVNAKPSACDFCYAERDSKRWDFHVWGKDAPRRWMSESYWNKPLKWNKKAKETKSRPRVFCASMAYVFEDRRDLDPWREKLWKLIEATPNLDWLLLTKRPALIMPMVPWKEIPDHVAVGTTTESQHWFDHRVGILSKVPARIRFVSAEPLFEPIVMGELGKSLHWVISGSESGRHVTAERLTSEAWLRQLKDECVANKTPFFYKQFTLPNMNVIHTPELDGRTWQEFPEFKKEVA